jgi:hypothetical protein
MILDGAISTDAECAGVLNPSQDGKAEWVRNRYRLKFRFGELSLGSVELSAQTLTTPFCSLVGGGDPVVPDGALNSGIDVVQFPSFPTDECVPRLSVLRSSIRYVPSQYRRFVIDMNCTFDEYLSSFSSKTRSSLRRKTRRCCDPGGSAPVMREFNTSADIEEFHRSAREISILTYQERLLGSGIPDTVDFKESITEMAERNEVRGYLLYQATRPIAYLLCPIIDGRVVYQYVGHDPAYDALSPGTVLLYLALGRLFEERRFTMFDFTEGEGAHKEFFANRSIQCADILFFRRTLKCRVMLAAHAALSDLSRATARLLETVGMKRRLKRLLRRVS